MPCGWGVKAGMVCVLVAGKTVGSLVTRVISGRFEVVHRIEMPIYSRRRLGKTCRQI